MAEEFTNFSEPSYVPKEGGMVQYGNDKSMVCMFYNRPTHNPAKSTEAGRPIFEDIPFVRIHPPGERLNIVDRPAKGEDAKRFPTQWAQFQQNKNQVPEGTPIDLLYPEYPAVSATLRASGVHTIEQCADLSSNAIENVGMGAQRYVNEAKKYLDASNKGVKASQFRHEMETKDREIKALNHTVDQLKSQIEHLMHNNTTAAALGQVKDLLAGAMERPQHLAGRAYDPQMAMINANSPTNQARVPAKRQRARLAR